MKYETLSLTAQVVSRTFTVTLFMAGDYLYAKQLVNRWVAENPMCFSMSKVDYVYTFGCESGFRLDAINYPRFPKDELAVREIVTNLAEYLMVELNQGSYTIQSPLTTTFHSRRSSDQDSCKNLVAENDNDN